MLEEIFRKDLTESSGQCVSASHFHEMGKDNVQVN